MNTKALLNKKIILGLSGGPDSVYLFHKLKNLHNEGLLDLTCAHLNHGWRDESGQDEAFCKNLCKKNNIPIIIESLENNIKYNGSTEEVGRKLRRSFFEKLYTTLNADYVVLAHHADDQQETFLWRIIRGTTLDGLTCMEELDGIYLRPLLNTYKKDIIKYLNNNNLNYVHDVTNTSDDFLRNRIRKYVIPALRNVDTRFDKKFADTLSHLKTENNFINQLSNQAYTDVFTANIGELNKFKQLDSVLQKRVLIKWLSNNQVTFSPSNSYIEEILRFVNSPRGGSHQINIDWIVTKKKNNLKLLSSKLSVQDPQLFQS